MRLSLPLSVNNDTILIQQNKYAHWQFRLSNEVKSCITVVDNYILAVSCLYIRLLWDIILRLVWLWSWKWRKATEMPSLSRDNVCLGLRCVASVWLVRTPRPIPAGGSLFALCGVSLEFQFDILRYLWFLIDISLIIIIIIIVINNFTDGANWFVPPPLLF